MFQPFFLWGRSSVGRALDWQSRGQEFDPPRLHQNVYMTQELKVKKFLRFFIVAALTYREERRCGYEDSQGIKNGVDQRKVLGWGKDGHSGRDGQDNAFMKSIQSTPSMNPDRAIYADTTANTVLVGAGVF